MISIPLLDKLIAMTTPSEKIIIGTNSSIGISLPLMLCHSTCQRASRKILQFPRHCMQSTENPLLMQHIKTRSGYPSCLGILAHIYYFRFGLLPDKIARDMGWSMFNRPDHSTLAINFGVPKPTSVKGATYPDKRGSFTRVSSVCNILWL